jgi:hypothetical protein
LEISPGQLPSLRGEAHTSSTREGVTGRLQAAWAARIASRVSSQSTEAS